MTEKLIVTLVLLAIWPVLILGAAMLVTGLVVQAIKRSWQ